MRILFYIEPLVERENPVWKKVWLAHFAKQISTALVSEGLDEKDLAFVVPSALVATAQSVLPNIVISSIDQTELIPRFGSSALAVASKWYLKEASLSALSDMANLVSDRLGNFTPTLCLTFSPAPFLKHAWPNAHVLHMEYGLVSRLPFPETLYFDPRGMFSESILAVYKDDLESWNPPSESRALLADLRGRFAASKSLDANPVASIVSQAIEPFDSAVLLALQFSNFYAYDANATFTDQYDLLVHSLASLPSNVALIVCEHPEYPVLRPETVEYLRERYPNFIWHPLFRQVYGVSHYLMPFIQGVITVSSSVGLQALLWKKNLAVVGRGHLSAIADTHDPGALPKFLGTQWSEQRERTLCWLLSNQHLPFKYLLNSGRFLKYLSLFGDETPEAVEKARVTSGLSVEEIRLAYISAWDERPVSPHSYAVSTDPNNFISSLYVATSSHGYDEASCIRKFVSFESTSEVSIDFSLTGVNDSPLALRFDPANRSCVIWINSMTLANGNGDTLWTLNAGDLRAKTRHGLELIPLEGKILAVCYDNDPHFELEIDFSSLSSRPTSNLVLSVNMVQSSNIAATLALKNIFTGLVETGAKKDALVTSLSRDIADRDQLIDSLNQTAAQLQQKQQQVSENIIRAEAQLALLKELLMPDGIFERI